MDQKKCVSLCPFGNGFLTLQWVRSGLSKGFFGVMIKETPAETESQARDHPVRITDSLRFAYISRYELRTK